jgi:hypothetical protein
MSQLPFPSYNPTANPVSTAVVPFQPSVPQQVEIGGGTAELGAAFSQFSQTLASFAANQISTNRAKAMAEGQLKAEKSRKTFRQLVESGEIKPEENPWEALGAASADGVMSAEKFRNDLRVKYDAKVANDPNFRLSVSSVEDFVNNEVQNAMTTGMQNPVWQRSFMKEVTPYLSSLSENHASGVATFRRQRMTEAMSVGVMSDIDLFNTDSKGMTPDDPKLPALTKRTQDAIQTRLDEAYQTFGKDAVSKIADTLVDLEIASGSDPKVMAILSKIKGGTGFVADTEQARAARLAKSDDIEKARLSRDLGLGLDFVISEISTKGEAPDEDAFHAFMKKNVRKDLPDADIYEMYGEVQKRSDSMKAQIVRSYRNQEVRRLIPQIAKAIAEPGSKNASLYKDPAYIKNAVKAQEMAMRSRLKMSMDPVDVDKSVDSVIEVLKFQAAQEVSASMAGQGPETRAQAEVSFASSLGITPSVSPSVRDATVNYLRNPSREGYISTIDLGLNMYREARRQGVSMESIGLGDMEQFYANMDTQLMAGSSKEAAAYSASQSSGKPSQARKQFDDKKIREAAINAANGWFTLESTARGQVDVLLSKYLDAAAADPLTAALSPEEHGARFVQFAESRAVRSQSGWTVLPVTAPASLRGTEAINTIENHITKVFKSKNSEVTGVRLVLGRNDQFQVFALSKDFPGGQIPSTEMAEALKETWGIGDNFSAREVDEVYRTKLLPENSRIKQEIERQEKTRMRKSRPFTDG